MRPCPCAARKLPSTSIQYKYNDNNYCSFSSNLDCTNTTIAVVK